MIESIAPRDGVPAFAGDRSIDAINGGDRHVADGDDLQYACIAPRAETGKGNDCDGPTPDQKNPLCAADGTQPYFKAYPGLRHLRIVHDLGASGFVASICNDTYRPAILGITDKLKAALNSRCLRSSLTQAANGEVECMLFEAMKDGSPVARCEDVKGLCTPGAAPCRKEGSDYPPLSPVQAAVQLNVPLTVIQPDGTARSIATQATVEGGNVIATGNDGRKHLICELQQFTGPDLTSCTADPAFTMSASVGGGWCYSTNSEIVGEACKKVGAPGTIRRLGGAEPRNGSEMFTYCFGAGGFGGGCGG